MTRLSILVLSSALICGLTACTVSSKQTMEVEKPSNSKQAIKVEKTSKFVAPMVTVKPGASVTLNSVLPKSMTSGSFQTVQLRLTEAYSGGTMAVKVEPSAGLSLFGGASSKTFDMAMPGEHVWNLDVKSEADGVYFLNVFAEAQGQPRAFSVRLDMGQTTQKMFDDVMPADGELVDGGKIRALEADETIK